ncbi:hypothetical protein N5W20_03610 [Candidatus Kirkpatrickella diaphorinae]|uniref:Uncharacterized protein n=1 Tax=Candidatus Kirkpatrickella diaphorinae TaxID=2984322 RepID=A0ABY6GM49_9PROT|nr:hypothetical protein [Candidatus Kirkpatrickella diaphorinae]UYH51953.1 hypothetical protein N5W20_03610 [Candidatus Kirkpatrickella diaphorinae]
MRIIPLALTALAIMLATPSVKADDQIDCSAQERSLSAGTHTGRFVDMRLKEAWPQDYVHFLFKNDSDNKLYCVRQSTAGNSNIVALAEKAFILDHKVVINTAGDYWLTGILFKATE